MVELPPEVVAAAERLAEKPRQKPKLPRVFREIAISHNKMIAIKRKGSAMSQADWRELKSLHADMKKSLIPGAVLFVAKQRGDNAA